MDKRDVNTVTRELMPWAGGPTEHHCGCKWGQRSSRTVDDGLVIAWELLTRCRMHTISALVD